MNYNIPFRKVTKFRIRPDRPFLVRTDNTMAKRKREGQIIQWPKEREDRQYNGQKKERRTDNTMAKRKREGQITQWPKEREKDR
jgi:hypothetical protein